MTEKKQLTEIQDLSSRGQGYQEQGNFDYAKKCYLKIVQILKSMAKDAKDKSTFQLLKEKSEKYYNQAKRVSEVQKNRNSVKTKVSKLGFPQTKPQTSNIKGIVGLNFPVQTYLAKTTNEKGMNNNLNKDAPNRVSNNNIAIRTTQNRGNNINNKKPNIQVDPDIQSMIVRNIKLTFDDIVGMSDVKEIIEEAVIRPKRRPDLFKGIRAPPRGILFYGPPGNGKTYLAKALANEANCTFFAVSASSIMNKFVGQSEKMLKKLFFAAEQMSPSIIFIDQIDSMLTARSQKENESSRRVKTQFLTLMEGITSAKDGDILVIGATNLPSQLDLAALRRFNKLIYVGLPDVSARQGIIVHNIKDLPHDLSQKDLKTLANKYLEGYSASQIKDIVKEVSMLPLRDIKKSDFDNIAQDKIRKIGIEDFIKVLKKRKPLLSKDDLKRYQGNFQVKE